jgi:hypothetical protein
MSRRVVDSHAKSSSALDRCVEHGGARVSGKELLGARGRDRCVESALERSNVRARRDALALFGRNVEPATLEDAHDRSRLALCLALCEERRCVSLKPRGYMHFKYAVAPRGGSPPAKRIACGHAPADGPST